MNDLRRWMTLCEMAGGYNLPRHIRPWLTGRCFDFALALHECLPDSEFIATGSAEMPDHVALRRSDGYYDARGGPMDEHTFLTAYRDEGQHFSPDEIMVIPRDTVELHAGVAGVPPPYKGNRDIAEARRAVKAIFGKMCKR